MDLIPRGKNIKDINGVRSTSRCVLLAVGTLLLTQCSFLPSSGSKTGASQSSPEVNKDARREKLVTDIHIDDARDISRPASSQEGFATSTPQTSIGSGVGNAPAPQNISGSAMAFKAKGLNVESLFDDRIRNDDKRFDRLEGAVQDINNYVAEMAPSIERLVAIESDIQVLVSQLEVLLKEDNHKAAPIGSPLPVKSTKKTQKKSTWSPSVKTNNFAPGTVVSLRASSDSSKTRFVFELSEKMQFSYDLDNSANILSVFFPDAKTASLSLSAVKKLKLVTDATVSSQGDGNGYVVAMSLSQPISLINQGKISPNKDNPMYRVFMDFR